MSIAGSKPRARVRVLVLRVFLALCAAMSAAPALSETIYLEPFYITEGHPMSCDVQDYLGKDLAERGSSVWSETYKDPPDLVVTGDFEEVGGVGWLTLRVFDSVVGKVSLGEKFHIPADSFQCRQVVKNIADKVLSPPHYERDKSRYLDPVSGVEFVQVPGGTFLVGKDRRTIVRVPTFFISSYEVTQGQWERVMGSNPAAFTGNPDRPVESVSFFDVQEYIFKLRRLSKNNYRLPNEMEWEYAAQTRGRGQRWAGTNDPEQVDSVAWTKENSGMKTHPVGQKKANGLGLCDMSGNVWEWCDDWFDEGYFAPKDAKTKVKKGEIRGRVIRGGSWMMDKDYAVTILREAAAPESRSSDNGFRLVIEPAAK